MAVSRFFNQNRGVVVSGQSSLIRYSLLVKSNMKAIRHLFYQYMKSFNNGEYLEPKIKVINISIQSIICQSNPVNTGNPFGDNEEEEW